MRAERLVKPERIWRVAHWKWELDPETPWYRKAFFKYVFRPFLHFAWNVVKIPSPKGVQIEGNRQRFFWFEDGGCFSSEDQADLACLTEWYGYKDVPLDNAFPITSAQYSSLVFPRQKNPRQHRKTPTFNLIVKDRREEDREKQTLARQLEQLNKVLVPDR